MSVAVSLPLASRFCVRLHDLRTLFITGRYALRTFERLCFVALGVLLVVGGILRWDRIGSLHDPRWQIALTLAGLAIGAWLACILVRGAGGSPGSRPSVWPRSCFPRLLPHPRLDILEDASVDLAVLVAVDDRRRQLDHIIWLRMAAAPDAGG